LRTLLLSLLLAAPALAQEKLTLDEAVRRALIRNSSAVIAQQEILRAEGILREQRAPSLPILTGNAVDTRIDSARSLAGRTLTPLVSLNANLTLTVPLIAPQHWVQWSHASDQVGVAQLSSEEVRRTVGVATARAYLGVMAQHRLVDAGLLEEVVARSGLLYAWTVNERTAIEWLRRLGVHGIATADPRLFA